VTYVFGEGNTYQDFNFADRNKEGTFSYQFYNAYKNVIADDYATTKQSEVTTILQRQFRHRIQKPSTKI